LAIGLILETIAKKIAETFPMNNGYITSLAKARGISQEWFIRKLLFDFNTLCSKDAAKRKGAIEAFL